MVWGRQEKARIHVPETDEGRKLYWGQTQVKGWASQPVALDPNQSIRALKQDGGKNVLSIIPPKEKTICSWKTAFLSHLSWKRGSDDTAKGQIKGFIRNISQLVAGLAWLQRDGNFGLEPGCLEPRQRGWTLPLVGPVPASPTHHLCVSTKYWSEGGNWLFPFWGDYVSQSCPGSGMLRSLGCLEFKVNQVECW